MHTHIYVCMWYISKYQTDIIHIAYIIYTLSLHVYTIDVSTIWELFKSVLLLTTPKLNY